MHICMAGDIYQHVYVQYRIYAGVHGVHNLVCNADMLHSRVREAREEYVQVTVGTAVSGGWSGLI